jgi:hypothetical protein
MAETKPMTPLMKECLEHGTLNGRERTEDLQRLRQEHGAEAVDRQIAAMIREGLMDKGQVLTPKGRDLLTTSRLMQ